MVGGKVNLGGIKIKLKRYCMIIGAEGITSNEANPDESIMRLKLMELKLVKQKQLETVISSVLSGSSPEELAMSMAQVQQRFDIIYITLGFWRENKLKIGKHMLLELNIDNTTGGIK
jgi:hypothetical protein